jgi:transposase family protein
LDKYPITARSLEKYFHINADQFERAYKDHLSGYRDWKEAAHTSDWLLFSENIGPRLSIDETSVSMGELYTILSNKAAHGRKGAIVAIIKGTKIEDVVDVLMKLSEEKRNAVEEVTMDFSDGMYAIVSQCFPKAMITIDRFHTQQLCTDAMQELRVRLKREERKEDIEAREQHKYRLERRKDTRKEDKTDRRGRKRKRKNEAYKPERMANGDTAIELLTRSRYLLMQSADKWTDSQRIRASILFERYPELKEAYSITHSLRMIYNNRNATRESGLESLKQWYNKVTDFDNDAFNTVSATIYEKQDEIVNYFVHRSTNAAAESLNSKIKNFRAQLHGVVDVEFFLFRLSLIYA